MKDLTPSRPLGLLPRASTGGSGERRPSHSHGRVPPHDWRFLCITLSILALLELGFAQAALYDVPDFVSQCKTMVVLVTCRDTAWSAGKASIGTAVLVGPVEEVPLALTCAHVIGADLDSCERPTRFATDISIHLPADESTSIPVRCRVLYMDGVRDFAILGLDIRRALQIHGGPVRVTSAQPSTWTAMSSLREGEDVIYVGYPLQTGSWARRAYSFVRRGMVSQVVPGRDFFLIDGFAWPGNSGGPVFGFGESHVKLAGIIQAYPYERERLFRRVRLDTVPGVFLQSNLGFSIVTPMDSIIPQLRKCLGLK